MFIQGGNPGNTLDRFSIIDLPSRFLFTFHFEKSFPEFPSLSLIHPVAQSELGLAILLPQLLKSVEDRVVPGGPQVDTVIIIL